MKDWQIMVIICTVVICWAGILWTLNLSEMSIDISMDDNALEAFNRALDEQNKETDVNFNYQYFTDDLTRVSFSNELGSSNTLFFLMRFADCDYFLSSETEDVYLCKEIKRSVKERENDVN